MPTLRVKRGTRSQLDTAAGSSGLLAGEPYLITDEDRLAIGTGTGAYSALLRQLETAIQQPETNLGNLGSGITLDTANGNKQRGTVDTASVTITVPAALASGAMHIRLRLTNSVGSVAITIAGAAWLGWIEGTAPTLHPDSGKENVLVFDGNVDGWTANGGAIGT